MSGPEPGRDPGLAAERTRLARRRSVLPFLVLALLGSRAALHAPVPGLVLAALGCLGAAATGLRRPPGVLTGLVLLAAVAAALLPEGPASA